jgi:hypothetical protein
LAMLQDLVNRLSVYGYPAKHKWLGISRSLRRSSGG